MSELHPAILGLIVVIAFVSLGIPAARQDITFSAKIGVSWIVIACVMNAIFQWRDPSPLNILVLSERAGTFECVLISIGYAFLLRALVGSVRSFLQYLTK